MIQICPTIMPLSDDPHVFRAMMERLGTFAPRVQIDLMDGNFAPHRNIDPINVWWPSGVKADIHLMYQYPSEVIDTLVGLRPHSIILHAESECDHTELFHRIKEGGVKTGIALLKSTSVEQAKDLILQANHVLLFAGELGFDGVSDLSVLSKVEEIRLIKPMIEIGWDGGANSHNVIQLVNGGIDVVNVGGALRHADSPQAEYARLVRMVS